MTPRQVIRACRRAERVHGWLTVVLPWDTFGDAAYLSRTCGPRTSLFFRDGKGNTVAEFDPRLVREWVRNATV